MKTFACAALFIILAYGNVNAATIIVDGVADDFAFVMILGELN